MKLMKLNVGEMHSDLEQAQREEVMHEFKVGRVNILVATDIVARGIDIDDIRLVINYDVPHDSEDYVHRIGRTARANNDGVALTFVNEKEQGKFKQIENFLEKDIALAIMTAKNVGTLMEKATEERITKAEETDRKGAMLQKERMATLRKRIIHDLE